jgi:hypothetical protein
MHADGEQGYLRRIDAEADNQRTFIRLAFKGPPCPTTPGPKAERAFRALAQCG